MKIVIISNYVDILMAKLFSYAIKVRKCECIYILPKGDHVSNTGNKFENIAHFDVQELNNFEDFGEESKRLVKEIIKRFHPDLVHISYREGAEFLKSVLQIVPVNCRVCLFCQKEFMFRGGFWQTVFGKYGLSRVNGFIAPFIDIAEKYKEIGGNGLIKVNPLIAVDRRQYHAFESTKPGAGGFIIGCRWKSLDEKNIDMLSNALSQIDFHYTLYIFGCKEEETFVTEKLLSLKITDQIVCSEYDEMLPDDLNRCDVWLSGGVGEKRAIWQEFLYAMSCSVPIISFDEISSWLKNQTTYVKSTNSLVDSLTKFKTDKKYYKKVVSMCQLAAEANFSFEAVGEKLYKFWELLPLQNRQISIPEIDYE